MPFEDAKLHLSDILESIKLIEEFVRDMDLDTYRYDWKTQAAVERKMLVISEAAIRLKEDAELLCPGVPWRDIRGIGNWLAISMIAWLWRRSGTRSRTTCRRSKPRLKWPLRGKASKCRSQPGGSFIEERATLKHAEK